MYNYISVTADEAATPARVRDGTIKLHDESGFAGMRKAGRLSAEILDALVPFIQPGVTTGAIDDLVREMMLAGGGIPAKGRRFAAQDLCQRRSRFAGEVAFHSLEICARRMTQQLPKRDGAARLVVRPALHLKLHVSIERKRAALDQA